MAVFLIKICGITNLEDALAAAEGGATAVGFNFYRGSKRYIAPETAAAIAAALPPGILKAGVFVNQAPEEMVRIAARVGLDVVQLHGDERSEDAPPGLRVWKAFRVDSTFQPEALDRFPAAEAFVLDGPAGADYGGSGKSFHWRLAAQIRRPIIVAGGLDAGNVREAIAQLDPWGVDACSLLESSPGKKDHQKMLAFLKAARSPEAWQ